MYHDAKELLSSLESVRHNGAEMARQEINAILSQTREPWLVYALLTHQMQTGSVRAAELLARVPDWHSRTVLDKLAEWFRTDSRGPALALFSHMLRRQPNWLYQIPTHPVLTQLMKLLKTLLNEGSAATFLSALLALVTLLPMLPGLLTKQFPDILDVLRRLAAWDSARGDPARPSGAVPGARRAHLQLGLYALFYHMYGMYPNCVFEFLRREYGGGEPDRLLVFNRTVRPMLDTVRFHPLLITSNSTSEAHGARFQRMEHHDIVYECRRLSLEDSERPLATFRARCATDASALAPHVTVDAARASGSAPNLTAAQVHTRANLSTTDTIVLASGSSVVSEPGRERWYSTAQRCATAPHTPLPHAEVASRTPLAPDGGSPPEAAIEATPENTPVKEIGGRRFNFPSDARGALAYRPGLAPLSQPPSPLKKEPSPSDGEPRGRDRMIRNVIVERAQAESAARQARARRPGSVPDSPLPIGAGAPAHGSAEWPIAKPQPQRDGVPLEPPDTREDREVTELTMRAAPREESDTPRGPSDCADEWGEEECEAECRASGHGLHMPPSSSLARLIRTRLRYYSHREPDPDPPEPGGSLPAPRRRGAVSRASHSPRTPGEAREARVVRVSSCPDIGLRESDKTECGTQTIDAWPAAFEFALSEVLAGAPGPAPQSAPQPTPGPADDLDCYISELVRSGVPVGAEALREQLQLTHAQLLYERHRKDVHATRNRRLLGKCRKNRAIETRAAELAERLRLLQEDSDELRAQAARRTTAATAATEEARAAVAGATERLVQIERELADARRDNLKLSTELEEARRRAGESAAHAQSLLANKFDLEARLDRALRAGAAGARLADCARTLQRELLMCAERETRLAEAVSAAPRASPASLETLLQEYRESAAADRVALAASAARLDASLARQAELEALLVSKESVVVELKRTQKTMRDEFEVRTSALHEKYTSMQRINQRLECRVVELARAAGAGEGVSAARAPPRGAPARGSRPSLKDVTNAHKLVTLPDPPAPPH